MTEWRMIVLLGCGPILWMIGGTWKKWARRFLWPAAVFFMLPYIHYWTPLQVPGTLIITCSLPYGDRTPWWLKVLVFAGLGAHVIWLDPIFGLWWTLGTSIALTALAYLSKRFNRVTWKVWEASAGILQAAGIILGVLR